MKPTELIIIVVVVAGFFAYLMVNFSNTELNKGIEECFEICESNNMEFNNYKTRTYQNDVCFCKNNDGGIETFVV